jgi:hypothetical protein
MGNQPPTLLPDENERVAHINRNGRPDAASCTRSPGRFEDPDHADRPMVINFARLVHITHATAMAGCSAR